MECYNSAKKTHSERRKADGPLELGVEWKVMEPGECGSYPHLILAVSACIALCMSCCEASADFGQPGVCKAKLNNCRNLLVLAQTYIGATPTAEMECKKLRTYYTCLQNISHGHCYGDLLFRVEKSSIETRLNGSGCVKRGPVFTEDYLTENRPNRPITSNVCTYDGKKVYSHCGLFGDPHLRTFNNVFQTCKVKGAWPLVNNKYITVQVTNDPVGQNGDATATSKVTVVIKKNEDCVGNKFLMYQAQTSNLPSAFDDGQMYYGKDKSVELFVKDPNTHVEIYIRYIDTTILLRQIGRYFTFAIKMPEGLINSTELYDDGQIDNERLELCTRGCPKTEQIDYKVFLAKKRHQLDELETSNKVSMSRNDAEILCRKEKVVDFYYDSCVFDLMTTGNLNFTRSAKKALQDVLHLTPDAIKMHKNRTDLKEYDEIYGSKSGKARTRVGSQLSHISLIVFLMCLAKSLQYHHVT